MAAAPTNHWSERGLEKEEGVGPSQLAVTARKTPQKGAKIGAISAFLMTKQGR